MDRESLAPYVNREQSEVKHFLLKRYLERLIMITGQATFSRIAYVDAFAGPWQSTSDDFSDTSPGLAISTIERCRAQLEAIFKRSVQFRVLFVEKHPNSFARLKRFSDEKTTREIEIRAINEDFAQSTDNVAAWIRDDEMTLVLVDPTGWKDVIYPRILAPIVRKPRVEMLINFMWNFINLATGLESQRENLNELLGTDYEALPIVASSRGEFIVRAYLQRLKTFASQTGPTARLRSTWFPVEHRSQDRVLYYLAYLTHHAKGLVTFLEEAQKSEQHQKEVKFVVVQKQREAEFGMPDLFGDTIDPEERRNHSAEWNARGKWLSLFPDIDNELLVDVVVIADLAEQSGCFIKQLQEALRQLIKEKILVNLDARRSRPVMVVDYKKGEKIRRLK
jgi:three-Cys-motif partner protein